VLGIHSIHGNSLAAYPTQVRFEVARDGNQDVM
jgi:hypothetical protein